APARAAPARRPAGVRPPPTPLVFPGAGAPPLPGKRIKRLFPLALLALMPLPAAQARPDSLTISVISVTAQSNSAAIVWRASSRVRAYAEYGLSSQYGIWTRRLG